MLVEEGHQSAKYAASSDPRAKEEQNVPSGGQRELRGIAGQARFVLRIKEVVPMPLVQKLQDAGELVLGEGAGGPFGEARKVVEALGMDGACSSFGGEPVAQDLPLSLRLQEANKPGFVVVFLENCS